jgi:hypothetical protein
MQLAFQKFNSDLVTFEDTEFYNLELTALNFTLFALGAAILRPLSVELFLQERDIGINCLNTNVFCSYLHIPFCIE